jgi:hypothetical protein
MLEYIQPGRLGYIARLSYQVDDLGGEFCQIVGVK